MIGRNNITVFWRWIKKKIFKIKGIRFVDLNYLHKRLNFKFRYLTSPLRILPDFFIIGAYKSGTSSLYYYLANHPYIIPALNKEAHFFNVHYNKGINWYKSFFPTKVFKFLFKLIFRQNFIVGEATPLLFSFLSIKRIFLNLPHIKIIIILRNPVNRAYSEYHADVRKHQLNYSFEEAIEIEQERTIGKINEFFRLQKDGLIIPRAGLYLLGGIYVEMIKIWRKYFKENQVYYIKSEDLHYNPDEVLKGVFKFLNLPNFKLEKYKKFNVGKYPGMSSETYKRLIEYFKPYNKKLYRYIGKDFKWEI